jgi:hypothetical protein
MNGFILIAKQMIDSDIWSKPATWVKLWLYILLNVNYQDNKKFKRGEGFFNFRRDCELIDEALTSDKIKKFLQYARKSSMISTTKSTRGIKIKVLNYDKYQSIKTYTSTTESTSHAPQKHHRSTTIPNEVKEYKEITNNTLSAEADLPFSFKDKVSEMFKSTDRRMPIIAYYWSIKGVSFENREQYSAGIKRELKASGLLKGYSNERIKEVCQWLKDNSDFKWTLESVHKYIDDDLKSIEKGKMTDDEQLQDKINKIKQKYDQRK